MDTDTSPYLFSDVLADFMCDIGLDCGTPVAFQILTDPLECSRRTKCIAGNQIEKTLCCIKKVFNTCFCPEGIQSIELDLDDNEESFDSRVSEWKQTRGTEFTKFMTQQKNICPVMFLYTIRTKNAEDWNHATLLLFDAQTGEQCFFDPVVYDDATSLYSLANKMGTTSFVEGYKPRVVGLADGIQNLIDAQSEWESDIVCLGVCSPLVLLVVVLLLRFAAIKWDSIFVILEGLIQWAKTTGDRFCIRYRLYRWQTTLYRACIEDNHAKMRSLMGLYHGANPPRNRFRVCGVLLEGEYCCGRLCHPPHGLCKQHYQLVVRNTIT